MNRPGIGREIVIAGVLSFAGFALYTVLSWAGSGLALRFAVLATLGAYAMSLIARHARRVGRITATALTLLLPVACHALDLSLAAASVVSLGWCWLLRCVFWHRGLFAIVADAGLSLCSLVFGALAFGHTGSVLAGLWCLLFAQAFFVFIPARWPRARRAGKPPACRFDAAEQRAGRALEQIFSNPEVSS